MGTVIKKLINNPNVKKFTYIDPMVQMQNSANSAEIFQKLDIDHSNSLEPLELTSILKTYAEKFNETPITESEIAELLKEKFGEETEGLTRDQFSELLESVYNERNDLYMSFKFFDTDDDGSIDFDELKAGMKTLYKNGKIKKIKTKKLRKMFEEADFNNDGSVDFEEYAKMVDMD